MATRNTRRSRARGAALIAMVLALAAAGPAAAQDYFGRNKVQYRSFDFQILKTEHFDIYYYPEETEAAGLVARMAERWQSRLSRFFGHELRGRQPVILYAVGSHFRQTNAIEGLLGEGTGGVTEPLKRRVVLPMAGSLADTDHVLGHELVHAFQFDLTGGGPGATNTTNQVPGILAYPLWYVEGMAEYLSLGPVDAQTAMWMRDAAMHDALPALKDLDDPRYFPYRWGQAFWAFVGAKYGDRSVASLIRSAANPKFDLLGLARQLGTDPDTLTKDWHAAIRASTDVVGSAQAPIQSQARLVIGPGSGGGRYNVGPEISPDGKQIAFFSERDGFSIDLYLADAETGRIGRRLLSTATDAHFDSLEFLNSAGAWSPDGRTLAIVAVRSGKPVLVLIDVKSGHVRRELHLPGLDDALNPSFAPDGASIALAGNAGGLLDLYRVHLPSGKIDRLTNDAYADLEPVFTPDGASLVFVTERFSTDLVNLVPGPLRLARLDLASGAVTPIPAFLHGKHLSPHVSADGGSITFIADPDGVSNLYRMPIDGGPIDALSSVSTGVAGITTSSPALSVSASGRLAFSLFENDGDAIYILDPNRIVTLVPPPSSDAAAVLPGRTVAEGDIDRLLSDYTRGLPSPGAEPAAGEPYHRNLTLDAVGEPTVSGSVSEFGGRLGGGMSALFGDMLGDRLLGVDAEIGGTFADFGAELAYLNRRHRWNWGGTVAVSPYAVGYLTRTDDATNNQTSIQEIIDRQTSRGAFGIAAFPFDQSSRLEFTGGAQALSFSEDVTTGTYALNSLSLVSESKVHIHEGPTLYLGQGGVAFVHDTSYYGATAPIYGTRSRLEVDESGGSLTYTTVLADWRRYFLIPSTPVTIAVRALHYGRYGLDAEDGRLVSLYTGYPEFVHGYGVGSFSAVDCLTGKGGVECGVFDSLLGSRMAVANFEVRMPLEGLWTGRLQYGRVPIDIAAFYDAGLAWTGADLPAFAGGSRHVVRSAGGAVRLNVFGLFAFEVAASHPFDRIDRSVQWQLGIREGF